MDFNKKSASPILTATTALNWTPAHDPTADWDFLSGLDSFIKIKKLQLKRGQPIRRQSERIRYANQIRQDKSSPANSQSNNQLFATTLTTTTNKQLKAKRERQGEEHNLSQVTEIDAAEFHNHIQTQKQPLASFNIARTQNSRQQQQQRQRQKSKKGNQVEQIIGSRLTIEGQLWYLVKWEAGQQTWEPAYNLQQAQSLIKEYEQKCESNSERELELMQETYYTASNQSIWEQNLREPIIDRPGLDEKQLSSIQSSALELLSQKQIISIPSTIVQDADSVEEQNVQVLMKKRKGKGKGRKTKVQNNQIAQSNETNDKEIRISGVQMHQPKTKHKLKVKNIEIESTSALTHESEQLCKFDVGKYLLAKDQITISSDSYPESVMIVQAKCKKGKAKGKGKSQKDKEKDNLFKVNLQPITKEQSQMRNKASKKQSKERKKALKKQAVLKKEWQAAINNNQ